MEITERKKRRESIKENKVKSVEKERRAKQIEKGEHIKTKSKERMNNRNFVKPTEIQLQLAVSRKKLKSEQTRKEKIFKKLTNKNAER